MDLIGVAFLAGGYRRKNLIISIIYDANAISDFQEYFRSSRENTREYSTQPSSLLAFLLVSGELTFTANFAIPKGRIEQMARKNHGANADRADRLPELL